ncbi:MAG: aspartyl protease family protein [Candidatus Thorarchaeota archaeon]
MPAELNHRENAHLNSQNMDLTTVEEFFAQGKFEQAEKGFQSIVEQDKNNFQAHLQLGRIHLFKNRFTDAEKILRKGLLLQPGNKDISRLLAQLFYRQDRYTEALPYYRSIDQLALAKKLELFEDRIPYEFDDAASITSIPFQQTDPLPVLKASVNGSEPINFVIDTGGPELMLDAQFAKAVGVKAVTSTTGSFAGGKAAPVEHGLIDSFRIGDFSVGNLPVSLMPVQQFSTPIFGEERPIMGIIGTAFLYHFLSTLDYPNGQLILAKSTEENASRLQKRASQKAAIVVPFWMAGSHFIVAEGRVNSSPGMLFFVDTGLAGGGFMCSEAVAKKYGVKLMTDQVREGMGAGGPVKTVPLVVDQLSLGEATESQIPGFVMDLHLDHLGFAIAGIISHAFFRSYALTFDFHSMQLILEKTTIN